MGYVVGGVLIIAGVATWAGMLFALVSWWVFCFGTVVIGLLLLFLAPHILMLPWLLTPFGTVLVGSGFALINATSNAKAERQRRDAHRKLMASIPSSEELRQLRKDLEELGLDPRKSEHEL